MVVAPSVETRLGLVVFFGGLQMKNLIAGDS